MPNNRVSNYINITTTDGTHTIRQASGGGYVDQPFSVTETLNNWRATEGALQQQEVQQDRELPIDVMKQRHLDGSERMIFHRPKKDWIVTKNGTEICRSSSVLDVSDLIARLV